MWDPGWLIAWAEGGVLARGPSLSGLGTHRALSYALSELSTVWREVALQVETKEDFLSGGPCGGGKVASFPPSVLCLFMAAVAFTFQRSGFTWI